jgi:type II secretory pathway pseudopilin PulG
MKNRALTSPAALLAATGLPVRRAFTVIELLVAIGAVAIVTVGLAAIFDAVGKTVQGGKRASALSQYATMVENQLRIDVSSIDPNSFMVIRQQFVDVNNDELVDGNDAAVQLYPNQTTGLRPRRIDELMFFAQGDFASARTPIVPDLVARSREARVYYGHGQKMAPSYGVGAVALDYAKPEPRFRDVTGAAAAMTPLGGGSASDPNRYAKDWTLLRHVTVLQQPSATGTGFADVQQELRALGVVPNPAQVPIIMDKDAQIALQPAAPTIFRTTLFPRLPSSGIGDCLWAAADNDLHPNFATGAVDVATIDLSEVRSWILGSISSPWSWTFDLSPTEVNLRKMQFSPLGSIPSGNPANINSLDLMHLWMSDAMPTQSLSRPPESTGAFEAPANFDPIGRRIRYEVQPPDLRTSLESSGNPPAGSYATRALQDAYERSAQTMLSAHNFAPRCSEFIVEWSFGRTHPTTGELIWHGPPRAGFTTTELNYYPIEIGTGEFLEEGTAFKLRYAPNASAPLNLIEEPRVHTFTDRLIYGETPDPANRPSAITSYFGYIDPTFDPQKPMVGRPGATAQEQAGVSVDNKLMEWPRPRLLRVTMSLADPQNPAVEETFQFVLEVPQARSK